MKKLFVVAMAFAAFVSCSKEEGVSIIESSKKAVEISISNYKVDSRAIDNPADNEVKGDGQTGTIEEQAADNYVAAEADQLVVLFANQANTVEQAYALAEYAENNTAAGTYRFHDINESVTQVAIVRKATATKAEDGTWTYSYDTTAANYVGDDLADYRAAAIIEYADNRGVDGMDLFAVSEEFTNKGTCDVTDPNDHKTTYTYTLFGAVVDVKPMLARVEVTRVACDGSNSASIDEETGEETTPNALGATTLAAFNGELISGGYDELKLGTLKFGEDEDYVYDFGGFVLKGIYEKGEGEREATHYEPGQGKAIAWNIATETAFPLTTANAMSIDMEASAYDYKVVNTKKNLTIGFDNVETKKFEPGKIYRLAINFGENNLDASNEAICVEVEVKVAEWVVVPVTPVFGAN